MTEKGYRVAEGIATPTRPQRSLYIDLIGERAEVTDRLAALGEQVRHAQANPSTVSSAPAPLPFQLSASGTQQDRVAELGGAQVPYPMSQLAPSISPEEQIGIAQGISRYFSEINVSAGHVDITGRTRLVFGADANVTDCKYPELVGRGILPGLACFIDQDFGIVVRRGESLFYVYESSEFEKTPKLVDGGANGFLGHDFLEWHRRIPHYGAPLVSIFEGVDALFAQDRLDMLVVDLRGRHLYTDAEIVVRRHERDYVVPLRDSEGKYVGMAVFADLFLQDINMLRNPFAGGKHLVIESPITFNSRFKVIKHAGFREHPSGVRAADGTPA
jgi:hypothetical protein